MYDLNSKQYIIKQKSGKTILISNKANSGVFSRYLNKKGVWTEPSLITKDILPEFSLCSDDLDKIHILCQDRQGHIKYMNYENEKWNSTIILRSRNFNPYDKHLCVTSDGRKVHFFYTLRYSDKNLLSYQQMKSTGEVSDPKVIDYVSESPEPYMVHMSSNGDLYLFYTYQDNKLSRIGYKKYTVSKNSWSDFLPITEFNGESSTVACASLTKDTLYTCWQKRTSSGYELVLSLKKQDSEEWDKEKLISKSNMQFTNSSMVVLNDKTVVYWIKDNNIIYTLSTDNCNTWSPPDTYKFGNNDQIQCVAYYSNADDEYFSQCCSILPGIINNGYKLAFTEEKSTEINIPAPIKATPDDFQLLVLDSFKCITQDIDAIKKQLTGIEAKIDAIENNQKEIEVELGRHNSKLSITDNDLSKIISMLTDLKEKNEKKQTKAEKPVTPQIEAQTDTGQNFSLSSQIPVMPGTGFASITPEFLRNLQKK